jgi:PAS domain S-box-containing protein
MSNQRAHSDSRGLKNGLPRQVRAPQKTRASSDPAQRKLQSATTAHQQTLRERLKTAEETLHAIQSGEVDALMVSGRHGAHVVSLKGGEPAYRMLVEAMSEGAATLSQVGAVLYCNRRFAEMMCRPPGKLIGVAVQSLVMEAERDSFNVLLSEARKAIVKGEFNLRRKDGSVIPVYLSLNRFRGFKGQALGMVITDLSEQKRKQAEEIKQAETTQRLLLERTLSAQEEERRRIARGLHDEAGQMLTALLVGLRTLEDARKMAEVKIQVHRLREITSQAIDEIGRLARGLHPTVLDDHGLGVALSRYAAEYSETHKIDVDLTLDELDSSTLPSEVQITLYRILQEALTNVARHSGAKTVSIRFARMPKSIEVAVVDDGCGFDAKAVAVSSHRLGIHSMRERAAMLGGTVSFIAQRKGTKILVQVPVAGHGSQPITEKRSA